MDIPGKYVAIIVLLLLYLIYDKLVRSKVISGFTTDSNKDTKEKDLKISDLPEVKPV